MAHCLRSARSSDPLDTSCRSIHSASDAPAGMITHDLGLRWDNGGTMPSMRPQTAERAVSEATPRVLGSRHATLSTPYAPSTTESPFAAASARRPDPMSDGRPPTDGHPIKSLSLPMHAMAAAVPSAGITTHLRNATQHELPSMRNKASVRDCMEWNA